MKLNITFSPQYESAIGGDAEYPDQLIDELSHLWSRHGLAIEHSLEEYTGLSFTAEELTAYLNSKFSVSAPLSVKIANVEDTFDNLIHELIHNLLMQNWESIKAGYDAYKDSSLKDESGLVAIHVVVHALHWLIYQDLFDAVRQQHLIDYCRNDPPYARSWEIAMRETPSKVIAEVFRNERSSSRYI